MRSSRGLLFTTSSAELELGDIENELHVVKTLVGVHMAGVRGHTWGNKPVLEPAPGHRNHPSPPLWLPHLQRQQPVQHELAGHGSSREA